MDDTIFEFKSRLVLTELLGKRASNLFELLEGIKVVPLTSIYHHTHRFLQQHHLLSPEPPNDFAYWVTNMLNDELAGEKLASIDVMQFNRLADLRNKLVSLLSNYLSEYAERITQSAPEGEEFHFMSSRIFVLPTPWRASNLHEFIECLRNVSIHSIYYHMFEARLRLEKGENDFSIWLRSNGYEGAAEELSKLDPYTFTLEGLRTRILGIVSGAEGRVYD
ncbi:MAG: DUF5752 family protein [Candidatus Kryptoniota bacterium]